MVQWYENLVILVYKAAKFRVLSDFVVFDGGLDDSRFEYVYFYNEKMVKNIIEWIEKSVN